MSNERQMTLGLFQYAQDSDEHSPASAAWMDNIGVYVRSDRPCHCPSAWDQDPAKYGYAFNSKLGGGNNAAYGDGHVKWTTPVDHKAGSQSHRVL